MSKRLNKIIEEMGGYGDMGLPDGEHAMGMGTPTAEVPRQTGENILKAVHKLIKLRHKAEEEEDLDDVDTNMDMDMEMDDENGVEEIKQFFLDNPEPSDEDIEAYAEEHGLDMDEMRQVVYSLIRELLGTEAPDDEAPVGDMDDMAMDDEMADDEMAFNAKV